MKEDNISQYSNSQIGSAHWFNTLVGNAANIGQYLHIHGSSGISETTLAQWGIELWERSKELMTWYETCGTPDKQRIIEQLEYTLNKLKAEV